MINMRRERFGFCGRELNLSLREEHDVPPNVFDKEDEVIRDCIDEVNENDVFFDVGADVGAYSVVVSEFCGSSVVSFEPDEDRTDSLEDNLDRYCDSYIMCNDVIGDGEDSVKLDSVVEDMGMCPDVIKIDVEGMEGMVLEGMKNVSDRVRTLYIEVHHRFTHNGRHGDVKGLELYGYSTKDVYDIIEGYGFEIEHLVGRGNVHNIKAYKQ